MLAAMKLVARASLITAALVGTASAGPKPADDDLNSVTTKLTDITENDAVDLAKVKSVIDRLTPDMIYTATDTPPPGYGKFIYLGDLNGIQPGQDPDGIANEASVGTAAVPYAVQWGRGGGLYLAQREVNPQHLEPNTPVLVWTHSVGHSIVLTLDGGIYVSNESKLPVVPGIPAKPAKPLQHDVLTAKQIASLEKAGQFPEGTASHIEELRTAGDTCAKTLWDKKYDAQDKANAAANIKEAARAARAQQIQVAWYAAAKSTCASQKKAFETALLKAIKTRHDARKALYDAAIAKLKDAAPATP
jgi:hypothetical protein